MRIKTQFIVTMLLFGAVLAVISASAIITDQRVESASEQENIAASIAQGASELSYLANDYLIYREDQQLERWQARFASFSGEVARLDVTTPEQQAVVRNIQANTQRMNDVFNSVVSAFESLPGEPIATIDISLLQLSWSRIAVQSQALVSDASRLSQQLDNQVTQLHRLNTTVITILIVAFIAYFLVNYLFTQRRALKGLAKLQDGTAVIGAGNLDYRIEEGRKDEIGDLAGAFNRMAGDLKTITASKTDLEREIEERKRTEEALRRSERRYRSFIEVTSQFAWVTDPSGLVVEDIPALRGFTGQTYEEAKGAGWADALHPDDAQRALEVWNRSVAAKTPYEVEYRMRRYDGVYRLLQARGVPITDDGGRVTEWVGTCIDITERKKAEEALKESEEKYRNLFNTMSEGFALHEIILDENGNPYDYRFVEINDAFGKLTGLDVQKTVGKTVREVIPGIEEYWINVYGKVALTGVPLHYENYSAALRRWFDIYAYSPRKNQFATIFVDVTERKEAEEKLNRSNAELEAANKELQAFSYSVSHDLRAPLRSMEGFSSALIEDYSDKLDEQGKKYLEYVRESSELMARLIDDLLKLSRVTRSEMNYEKVNLSQLADKITAGLKKAEPGRKARIKITPDMYVYGDQNLLRLALENLLGNAWKFTGKADLAIIEMGTTTDSGKKTYFIRDNGVGFDMTYANKLFAPFQRLHKATEFAGTGIGLATVQRIIRRHGGEVWAESKTGEGATFYFTVG